eukprot:1160488-Pelagomonas_calceolata.AAC.5
MELLIFVPCFGEQPHKFTLSGWWRQPVYEEADGYQPHVLAPTTSCFIAPTTCCALPQICKEADGYQPHVMAPEAGIRRLGSDALDLVNAPVNAAVQQVYTLLVNAARCAAQRPHNTAYCPQAFYTAFLTQRSWGALVGDCSGALSGRGHSAPLVLLSASEVCSVCSRAPGFLLCNEHVHLQTCVDGPLQPWI